MTKNEQVSEDQQSVFNPSNEPYLGRHPLFVLDQTIVAVLELNLRAAQYSHTIKRSAIQDAACQLIPASINLALSMRELVRQGYLYGAVVLTRPLAERVVTLLWLSQSVENLAIWDRGWNYKERPSLATMMNDLGGRALAGLGAGFTKKLNSLTHGDPDSSAWTLVTMGVGGGLGHASSKMLDSPHICDEVCTDAAVWLAATMGLIAQHFPDC